MGNVVGQPDAKDIGEEESVVVVGEAASVDCAEESVVVEGADESDVDEGVGQLLGSAHGVVVV